MITFKYTSPSLVAADLDDIEERFHFRFPPDFRAHYLQHNGGRPDKDRFVDEKGPCIVDTFLPMKYSRPPLGTLELSIQRVKIDQALLPEHLVPFAVDPGGDYYCFSSRNDDLGAIYVFRMDHYADPTRATEYLAPSLSSFLARLTTKDAAKKWKS